MIKDKQKDAIMEAVIYSLHAAMTDYRGDMDEKFKRSARDAYLGYVTSDPNSPPGIVFNRLHQRAKMLYGQIMLVLGYEQRAEPIEHVAYWDHIIEEE